ncbi:hypothetical protein C9374_004629 [Naegleria lovaniensis]|uniref:Saposin B-type domain-containing protein n=1 Tax=Naegleria lovaniensis TaxID=51637 RepID=A0AA88GRM2_NAELO|nr:uncharacterized protein C9374_004629 [Naegleria lovaniensis]KAG2383292.1 hypothetical protein C9374_004629 [Naegleria lovaniensis]
MKAFLLAVILVLASLAVVSAAPSEFCDVCKYAVQQVDQLALQNEAAIQNALLGACQQLGDNQFGKICNTIVLVYGNELINALVTYENPTRVCTDQLPLCPKNNTVATPAPVVVPKEEVKATAGDAECEICKFLIQQVEAFIASNHSQAEIQKELNKLCSSVPSIFTQTCLSVARMVPYILKKLEEHNSPGQVCQGLHLCTSSAVKTMPTFQVDAEVKGLIPCPACLMAMELVEQEISQSSVQSFVEDKLKNVCAKLPSTFSGYCASLVNQYFPVLVQKLLLAVSPEKICKLVDACPASSSKAVKALKATMVKLN